MKLILPMPEVTNMNLKFATQLGVEGIQSCPTIDNIDIGFHEYSKLIRLKSRIESYGLSLEAISLLPWRWSYKWILGLPGRDEQIENCHRTIVNMGAAGIPILIYNMHALRIYRTSNREQGRGGAYAAGFNFDNIKNIPLMAGGPDIDTSVIPDTLRHTIDTKKMWDNLSYFLKSVVPVAEKAGVKIALHPDDPPVPLIGGVARILTTPASFRRALKLVSSEYSGMVFCQGCFSEMGANIVEEIEYFGAREKIFAVHFRNIRGTAEHFVETFPDEGQQDMLKALKAYKEVGFDGPISPDHSLGLVGDTRWGHRYWAYAVGYIHGLLHTLDALSDR